MEAYEAIITRQSIPNPSEEPLERDVVEKLLEAGVRAPSHYLTQPWRFVVLTGDARLDLGKAWALSAKRQGKNPETTRDKVLRAPVIICVVEQPHTTVARVIETEEHYSVGAVIENILLAAHALGLAAMIRTGDAAKSPEVRAYLDLKDDEILAAFIYVGHVRDNGKRPLTRRTAAAEKTEWRGW
jgi:nitroreductase